MSTTRHHAPMSRICRRNDIAYTIIDGLFYIHVSAGPCELLERIDALTELYEYL